MSFGLDELIKVLHGKPAYRVFSCPQQYDEVKEVVESIKFEDILVEVERSDFILYGHVLITGPGFEYKLKLNNLFTVLETLEIK